MVKKILVIGGAGFIGSNVVEKLTEDETNLVVVLDNLYLGTLENIPNVTNENILKGTMRQAIDVIQPVWDYIFFFGNYSSAPMFQEETPSRLEETLVDFIYALELAAESNAKLIYASTSSILGPRTYYSAMRECYEILASTYYNERGVESVGFRYMSVYGGSHYHEEHKGQFANVITQMYWKVNIDLPFTIYGDGEQSRDFIHVLDVADVTVKAMNFDRSGAWVFEVGTGKSHTFNEVYQLINKRLKKDIPAEYKENPIKNYVQDTLSKKYADVQFAFDWKPKIDLEIGIDLMCRKRRK